MLTSLQILVKHAITTERARSLNPDPGQESSQIKATKENGNYKIVGTRPIRPYHTNKISGKAIYGGDTRLADMLHGQVLRSPHTHPRIRSIDTSKAEALDGVRAVVTADDMIDPVKGSLVSNTLVMIIEKKVLLTLEVHQ